MTAANDKESAATVTPQRGDLLCIRYGPHEWGYSGDKFHSQEGDQVTAHQHFSGGQTRSLTRHKDTFRVLRGTQLFFIA